MRTFRGWSWGLLVLILALGCASEEGAAQDQPAKPVAKKPADTEKPRGLKPKSKTKGKKAPEDKTKYKATVTDKPEQSDKPFVITEAVIFVPEVTLFGGGAGEEVKELKLRRGSAEITIPFAKIDTLEVGKLAEDRLSLTVKLRGAKPEDAPLVGTVKASLELRGKLGDKGLDTTVKLRHAKSIAISPIR